MVVASLLAAALVNTAMFGFYSYLSDFLGAAAGLPAAAVSGLLFVYGLANIVGNTVAGRTLGYNARATMLAGPVTLAVLYGALISWGGAGSSVLGTLPLLAAGLAFTMVRLRLSGDSAHK